MGISDLQKSLPGPVRLIREPADKHPKLGHPCNLTLPLPAPTGKPQPYLLPFLSMRVVPNTGAEKTPYAVAELNTSLWELTQGPIFGSSNAAVDFHPSEKNPIHKLPVNYVLGGSTSRVVRCSSRTSSLGSRF